MRKALAEVEAVKESLLRILSFFEGVRVMGCAEKKEE